VTKDLEKTILVTTMSAIMAHVVRPLEVAKILKEKGYRVVFAGSGSPTRLVQQVGFELRYLPDWDLPKLMTKLRCGAEHIYEEDTIEEWVEAELSLYRKLDPIMILDDARVTSHISARIAGLPRTSIQNAYTHSNAIKGFMDPELKSPRSGMESGDEIPFNQVREKYGLPPIEKINEILQADLNLLCDIPEYAPLHEIPQTYHYVGPITWGHDLLRPAWLDSLDRTKPILYFTMGSTGPQRAFQAALKFLSSKGYQVIMTLGSMVNRKDLDPLPPGFFAASYASGETLAAVSDIVICHGGNGTAYQGLGSGVPLITWPILRDQVWNARRLSELGVSKTINNPAELPGAVETILGDSSFKHNAGSLQRILNTYNGPNQAANLIHKFIKDMEK
jgi:UDP:flavonoid glycosyltransferase YjiC (YdhE family)